MRPMAPWHTYKELPFNSFVYTMNIYSPSKLLISKKKKSFSLLLQISTVTPIVLRLNNVMYICF